jgi:hypothetical protein
MGQRVMVETHSKNVGGRFFPDGATSKEFVFYFAAVQNCSEHKEEGLVLILASFSDSNIV